MPFRRSALSTEMLEDRIVVPSASILTLNATPVQLIAAGGAGVYTLVEYIEAFNGFGTLAYVVNAAGIDVLWAGGATIANLTQAWGQATANQLAIISGSVDVENVPANAAVQLQALSTNPTTGDGDWTIHIVYRQVTYP